MRQGVHDTAAVSASRCPPRSSFPTGAIAAALDLERLDRLPLRLLEWKVSDESEIAGTGAREHRADLMCFQTP